MVAERLNCMKKRFHAKEFVLPVITSTPAGSMARHIYGSGGVSRLGAAKDPAGCALMLPSRPKRICDLGRESNFALKRAFQT